MHARLMAVWKRRLAALRSVRRGKGRGGGTLGAAAGRGGAGVSPQQVSDSEKILVDVETP